MPKKLLTKKQMKKAARIYAPMKEDFVNTYERNYYINGIIAGLAIFQNLVWNEKIGMLNNRYEIDRKINKLLNASNEGQNQVAENVDNTNYNINVPRFPLPHLDF